MSDPTLTSPPETPVRGSATFSGQVASFLAWLTVFVPQLVIAISWMRGKVDEVSGNASQVATDATLAETARQGAEQARDSAAGSVAGAGAPAWVSGTTYAIGNVRYSPITFKTYRRRTAGAGTVDPSADKANWSDLTVPVSGNGVLDTLAVRYATLNGTALTSGHFAEFQEQGRRALRNILSTAAAAYDFTDYLALDGAQAAFTDTAGAAALTTPGTSLARMNDATGNAANAVQANAGQRPLFGAAPRNVRNLLTRTEEFNNAVWAKTNVSVSAVGSGRWKIIPNSGTGPRNIMQAQLAYPDTQTHIKIYLEQDGARYCRVFIGAQTNRQGHVTIDLQTGAVVSNGVGGTVSNPSAIAKGLGWDLFFTVSLDAGASGNNFILIPSTTEISVSSSFNVNVTGDGASGIIVGYPQLELGSVATPYQRVGAATDITETGVPSYGFARFDNADDALTTTLPDGHTGDLLIFGRKGTWKEPNTVASAGTFTLGGTIAGTPATPGILRATGDVLGYLLAGKTLTDEETRRLTQYYASMGAKGLLELGPDLITNGTFDVDVSGWIAGVSASLSVVSDALRVEATASSPRASAYRDIPTIAGKVYNFTGDVVAGGQAGRFLIGTPASGAAIYIGSFVSSGTQRICFVATSATSRISVESLTGAVGDYSDFDNISVRALKSQEAF